jgi:hypothetical protein
MADVKFDIEVSGIKELKEAAAEFDRLGKISAKLSAQYKPLGAQTTRLVQEQSRLESLQKRLTKAVKSGLITKREMTEALEEEIRASKEKVLTDRTLIAEARKKDRLEAQAEKKKKDLVRAYAPLRAAETRYLEIQGQIETAHRQGIITLEEKRQALDAVTKQFREFENGVATGGNQFARFNVETYKAQKRLNTFRTQGLQQAGYQVGDFAVQVQSGTNVAVAFGQQMSQLLGVFGPAGAIAGAGVAIGTAFVAPLLESWGASKTFKEGMDELTDSIKNYGDITAKILASNSLSEEFGKLNTQARQVLSAIQQIAGITMKEQLGEFGKVGKVTKDEKLVRTGTMFFGGLPTFGYEERYDESQVKAAQKFLDAYGGTLEENSNYAQRYLELIRQIQQASDFESQIEPARQLSSFLEEHVKLRGEDVINLEEIESIQKALLAIVSTQAKLGQATAAEVVAAEDAASAQAERIALNAFKIIEQKKQAAIDAIEEEERVTGLVLDRISDAIRKMPTVAEIIAAEDTASAEAERIALKAAAAVKARAEEQKAISEYEKKARAEVQKYNEVGYKLFKKYNDEQKALNEKAEAQLAIENQKIASLNAQVDAIIAGDAQAKASRDAQITAAGEIKRIQLEKLGYEGESLEKLVAAEEALMRAKFNLADATEEARELAKALKEVQQAQEALSDFGLDVTQRLLVAQSKLAAARYGRDISAAGTATSLILQAREKYRAIPREERTKEDKETLNKTIKTINQLRVAEEELARLRDSTKTGEKITNKLKEYLKDLETERDIARETLGLSQKEREVKRTLREFEAEFGKDKLARHQETIEQYIREIQQLKELDTLYQNIGNNIASSFETAMMSIVEGTQSVEDAFRIMAADIIKHLYKVLVVQTMINAVGGYFSGSSNKILASIGGALEDYDGGGYTGSGARSGGMDGKGGFLAMLHPRETVIDHTKGQSGGVTVQQNFNFSANGDESVKRMIAQAAPQIAKMTERGIMDSRRRGGQMKAVFG